MKFQKDKSYKIGVRIKNSRIDIPEWASLPKVMLGKQLYDLGIYTTEILASNEAKFLKDNKTYSVYLINSDGTNEYMTEFTVYNLESSLSDELDNNINADNKVYINELKNHIETLKEQLRLKEDLIALFKSRADELENNHTNLIDKYMMIINDKDKTINDLNMDIKEKNLIEEIQNEANMKVKKMMEQAPERSVLSDQLIEKGLSYVEKFLNAKMGKFNNIDIFEEPNNTKFKPENLTNE